MRLVNIAIKTRTAFLVTVTVLFGQFAFAADAPIQVNVDNFVRAEMDTAIRNVYDLVGFGKFFHVKTPTPLDQQTVIRMNRDTLYSAAALDLSTPATVTLPDTKGRYMSLHVINQDHFMFAITEPGRHELTKEKVGSRYATVTVRLFVDANDSRDITAANALQDMLKIESGGAGTLDMPDWDQDQLKTARGALNTLAKLGMNASRAFGTREETDPIQHLVGAAAGWGGLPEKYAFYLIEAVEKNDGTPHAVTVKVVPVDAFWSITVYNADGYLDENPQGAYSFNSQTAKPNDDGSITIYFGGCDDGRQNCLPISQGWNYAVRMYDPRPEILDGTWTFPSVQPLK